MQCLQWSNMGPDDIADLSRRIMESAKDSTDEKSLELGLWSVIDDFSERFQDLGRASALHEVTSFLFNNNARHLSFFPSIAKTAYEALGEVSKWHEASIVAEHMTGYQIELLTTQQGDEESLRDWFARWADSVRKWCETSVTSNSWHNLGTGILNRCEWFTVIPLIQQDVYDFWDSIIEKYGPFAPTKETLDRHRGELNEMRILAIREMDYYQLLKVDFTNRVNLLAKLDVGDLVDVMNRAIEYAPKRITDEEIEVELNTINSANELKEIAHLSNELASRLRIEGKINKGIEILSKLIEKEYFEIQGDKTAWTYLKLAIYYDEVGRGEDAEPLFKHIADLEPSPDANSVSIATIRDASHRYASFLSGLERYTESKKYSIRENTLAELTGDPFLFVRSCFNVAADCKDLGEQKEALEWFILGMMNIKDSVTMGPLGKPPLEHQNQIIELSRNHAIALGIEDRWSMMMQHIFGDEGNPPANEQ
jgi:tetratricopeptide (TPR) repeat protein